MVARFRTRLQVLISNACWQDRAGANTKQAAVRAALTYIYNLRVPDVYHMEALRRSAFVKKIHQGESLCSPLHPQMERQSTTHQEPLPRLQSSWKSCFASHLIDQEIERENVSYACDGQWQFETHDASAFVQSCPPRRFVFLVEIILTASAEDEGMSLLSKGDSIKISKLAGQHDDDHEQKTITKKT